MDTHSVTSAAAATATLFLNFSVGKRKLLTQFLFIHFHILYWKILFRRQHFSIFCYPKKSNFFFVLLTKSRAKIEKFLGFVFHFSTVFVSILQESLRKEECIHKRNVIHLFEGNLNKIKFALTKRWDIRLPLFLMHSFSWDVV